MYTRLEPNYRNNPPQADAQLVAKLCNHAAVQPTKDVVRKCNIAVGRGDSEREVPVRIPMTFYMSPGGILFQGKKNAQKFIAFLYNNTDDGHRCDWGDITGREQHEWYNVWKSPTCGCGWTRMEQATRGLRGTNLSRMTTEAEVEAVLATTPSLRKRKRPAGFHMSRDEWNPCDRLKTTPTR